MSTTAPTRTRSPDLEAVLAVVAVASGVILSPLGGVAVSAVLAATVPGRRRLFLLIALGWVVFILVSYPMFGGGSSGGS